ncbi:MAG: hypothetical protein OQJ93_09160 [Ignavibacteriaceae bacterium]|jgi:hypothetical protein|nr:hypothetical protein [Ignavibacteriaceae bacterium]MCW8817662.1 hypothetical protein [Ignavibacteriaceae bacterium]MCW9095605.1 hypothetical protein [Ignavibacteriaceae bacterium]MCW9097546.1 hypothetical protein [Ignavibacteriaceae bacterium]
MKRLIISLVFLFLLIGLSGCYTILQTSEECYEEQEVIVYYPVPVPIPPPPPISPPVSPIIRPPYVPSPPVKIPEPKPIIRHPENPNRGGGSGDQVRDPLRGHGERGNSERNPEQDRTPDRNDGGRR